MDKIYVVIVLGEDYMCWEYEVYFYDFYVDNVMVFGFFDLMKFVYGFLKRFMV